MNTPLDYTVRKYSQHQFALCERGHVRLRSRQYCLLRSVADELNAQAAPPRENVSQGLLDALLALLVLGGLFVVLLVGVGGLSR